MLQRIKAWWGRAWGSFAEKHPRNISFKSHGPLGVQIAAHSIATIGVFLVMNLFNWVSPSG